MGGMVFNFNDFNHNSILLNLEQHDKTRAFISIGSVLLQFGPLLFFFGICYPILSVQSTLWFYWDFINYDVLYWINCMILLLGFELNATITKLKRNSTIKLI
jgi:membrane protein